VAVACELLNLLALQHGVSGAMFFSTTPGVIEKLIWILSHRVERYVKRSYDRLWQSLMTTDLEVATRNGKHQMNSLGE
jgi:hypothetical protein